MVTRRIYIVRHGITDVNRDGVYCGRTDYPLNREGLLQSYKTAERLKSVNLEAIYSSSLLRAYETASIIAQGRDLEVRRDPALLEIDFGEYEGKHAADFEGTEFQRRWFTEPADLRWPGGETLSEVQRRVSSFMDRIMKAHTGNLCVVSHAFAIISYVCALTGVDLNRFRVFKINHGSITTIEILSHVNRLLTLNESSHLI